MTERKKVKPRKKFTVDLTGMDPAEFNRTTDAMLQDAVQRAATDEAFLRRHEALHRWATDKLEQQRVLNQLIDARINEILRQHGLMPSEGVFTQENWRGYKAQAKKRLMQGLVGFQDEYPRTSAKRKKRVAGLLLDGSANHIGKRKKR